MPFSAKTIKKFEAHGACVTDLKTGQSMSMTDSYLKGKKFMPDANLLEMIQDMEELDNNNLMFKLNKGNQDAGDVFVKIEDLVKQALENGDDIEKGIDILNDKLAGQKYLQHHFGRVGMIPISKVYSNIDIQRIIEQKFIGSNILPIFDPRITQPINVIFYPAGVPHPITGDVLEDDIYTAWDGQQTSSTIEALMMFALIDVDEEFMIKANIIDYDLEVPGSTIKGEAVANFGFRTINGTKAKKPVDPYYVMRSEHNGVRLYNSSLQEDIHSNEMWTTLEKHQMLPAPTTGTEKKLPGHIAHVSGMKSMASHDTENFDIKTFENAISFLSKFFSNDNGINSSFYMAIAELFQNIKDQEVVNFNEKQFADFIKAEYSNGDGFSAYAKDRLHKLQVAMGIKKSWTDACSVPYMIADYVEWCQKNKLDQGKLPIPEKLSQYVSGKIDFALAGA